MVKLVTFILVELVNLILTLTLASSWYFIRAPHMADVLSILERVKKVAQGAAMMTETSVDIDVEYGCWEMKRSKSMTDVCFENLQAAPSIEFTEDELEFAKALQATLSPQTVASKEALYGVKDCAMAIETSDRDFWQRCYMTASTDTGDVSYQMPMSAFTTSCWPVGVVPHTWQAAAGSGASIGEKGALHAAYVLAGQAFDFLNHPELVEKAQKEFDANQSIQYQSILNHFE